MHATTINERKEALILKENRRGTWDSLKGGKEGRNDAIILQFQN